MRFILTEDLWILDALSPAEWHLVRELPGVAGGGSFDEAARDRLFPSPLAEDVIANENTLSQVEDWEELIRPELEDAFSLARSVVGEDLKKCRLLQIDDFFDQIPDFGEEEKSELVAGFPEMYRLEVPQEHTEAWYSTLNQARLLMNEAYGIAEAEEREAVRSGTSPNSSDEFLLLIAQYELYSVVQSILVENIMEG